MSAGESLTQRRCVPCEEGASPLLKEEATALLQEIPEWELSPDTRQISRTWVCKNFSEAMNFIQKVGQLAEQEDHHPDIHLFSYKHVRLELSTHAIGGLSENDFILAAKVNALLSANR